MGTQKWCFFNESQSVCLPACRGSIWDLAGSLFTIKGYRRNLRIHLGEEPLNSAKPSYPSLMEGLTEGTPRHMRSSSLRRGRSGGSRREGSAKWVSDKGWIVFGRGATNHSKYESKKRAHCCNRANRCKWVCWWERLHRSLVVKHDNAADIQCLACMHRHSPQCSRRVWETWLTPPLWLEVMGENDCLCRGETFFQNLQLI